MRTVLDREGQTWNISASGHLRAAAVHTLQLSPCRCLLQFLLHPTPPTSGVGDRRPHPFFQNGKLPVREVKNSPKSTLKSISIGTRTVNREEPKEHLVLSALPISFPRSGGIWRQEHFSRQHHPHVAGSSNMDKWLDRSRLRLCPSVISSSQGHPCS